MHDIDGIYMNINIYITRVLRLQMRTFHFITNLYKDYYNRSNRFLLLSQWQQDGSWKIHNLSKIKKDMILYIYNNELKNSNTIIVLQVFYDVSGCVKIGQWVKHEINKLFAPLESRNKGDISHIMLVH